MLDLRAVDPDGARVVDGDGEGVGSRAGLGVDEARVEAAGSGARRVEVALHNVVAARVEVEDDGVALGGSGAVGRVRKAAIANEDVVGCGGGSGDEAEEGEEVESGRHRGRRCSIEWYDLRGDAFL